MAKIFNVFFLLFFSVSSLAFAKAPLPEPYNSIEVLPFDGHGWFVNDYQLKSLIKTNEVKTIIEVGCWLGCSTRYCASLLPKNGKLYAVDHWLGSIENQLGEVAYHPALLYLYEQFLSNVIHAGLTDKIVPVRMSSLEAVDYFHSLSKSVIPDLIYIDASHDTASVYADLQAWYPFIENHGILCGDDWGWESVRIAVCAFAKEKGLEIESLGNFWRLK